MRRLALVILVGCSGGHAKPDAAVTPPDVAIDAAVAPAFRNPVALPDDQLAHEALSILGALTTTAQECNGCHGLTRQHIRYWRALSDVALGGCLTDLAVASTESAHRMIDCLRSMPELATSDFEVKKLGVFTTAARLPWFEFLFWRAYGDQGNAKLAEFQNVMAMPRGMMPPLTQQQFDVIAEWFVRGVPQLDETLPQDPQPSTCDPGVSADVVAHVTAMKTMGWRQLNKDAAMAMFGCGTATDPRQCLQSVPLGSAQPYGAGWDLAGRGKLRVLQDVTYRSSYWSRSSPDGRFIAHGVANVTGSYVLDLQRNATVAIATNYDPGFFPDGTGFVFQGGPRNTCALSVLTSNPTNVTMTEPACTNISAIGLYQHVGRALAGDYFAIDSEFVSDDGGHQATLQDPDTFFGPNGHFDLTPMIYDGTKYTPKPQIKLATPYEGDSVLSPSARLVLSRVANPTDRQIGYVLRKVIATPSGSTYTVTAPEIARYCVSGGKPAFSYDERWIVYHHYVTSDDAQELGFTGPSDPAFQPYRQYGAANIYLIDLATGVPHRITNMAPGQYALFPHFRSDGWIYADVRDTHAGHEYMVASDAALIAE